MEIKENITAIDNGQGQSLSVVEDTYRIIMPGESGKENK
jgi:hypothetical protein